MITCYEVKVTGDTIELPFGTANMSSEGVYCFIVPDTKLIYYWKGRDASIRKKFTGAKAVSDIRKKMGFDFRVHPIDEGAEPIDFRKLFKPSK